MIQAASEPGTRRPTLKSVATAAGVSASTASLVFSGNGPVAEATKKRVLRVAAELGYSGPDPLAASLRRGRAGVVGVVVGGSVQFAFRDPYAVLVADGLAAELEQAETGMLLLSQRAGDRSMLLERLRRTALDAVVFFGCGPRDAALVPYLRERGIPMVALGGPYAPGVVNIDVDNRAAMHTLIAHLRELGHHRFGVVSLPRSLSDEIQPRVQLMPLADARPEEPSPSYSVDVTARLIGLAEVLDPATPTAVVANSEASLGASAGAALLDLPEPPTAVIALSDVLALGVIRAAEDRGLSIPEDLSVTGFDGVPLPWWPGELTTVVQPAREKGVTAGRLVRNLLAGERPGDVVLETELRIGSSTAPCPGDAGAGDPGPGDADLADSGPGPGAGPGDVGSGGPDPGDPDPGEPSPG